MTFALHPQICWEGVMEKIKCTDIIHPQRRKLSALDHQCHSFIPPVNAYQISTTHQVWPRHRRHSYGIKLGSHSHRDVNKNSSMLGQVQ